MLFISRFIVSVGALLGSTRDSSGRPSSDSYAKVVRWRPAALNPAGAKGHTITPVLKVNPSGLIAHITPSRRLFVRPRRPTPREKSRQIVQRAHNLAPSHSTSTFTTHPNLTRLGNDQPAKSTLFTVLPYDGPRELAIYCRPTSLVVYTGPINYVRFWVDPSHYELVLYIYRPRFVIDACLAKQYGHLDPTNFERCLRVFGPTFPQYSTIGRFERRPEERAAWTLFHLCTLGFLFALVMMASEDIRNCGRNAVPAASLGGDHNLLTLPGLVYQVSSQENESDAASEVNWWKADGGEANTSEYLISTNLLELPVITTPEPTLPADASIPTPPLNSTDVLTAAKAIRDVALPSCPRKVPALPSGPRFKTAAWRRRRVK
ncbi:hypothetical protein B0J17DRAFT_629025 [Rhizoctonia solani]|nr:hypothetical protein B0J17DRAFT_629025 [Rhizoctonia solani]